MADENIKTTLQFNADITDFKKAMSEANAAIKLANSQFKAASSGMDDWSGSTDGLRAKLDQLTSVEEAQKRQLDVLRAAYDKVAAEQGEASAAAVELQTKINNQQAAINKTAREHRDFANKLEEVERGAGGAESALKKAGDAAEEAGNDAAASSEGWTIAKDVIADMISNVISSAVDSLLSAAEATREYRREMAQLSQNASDSGNSMEVVKGALSDVASVTGDTEAAMEGLNMLMATGLKSDNLTFAAEALAGAATKFDGLNFEAMAEGLQESLAVGEAVGPFAELIERTGGNLETFNEGMGKCTTAAEKQQYALQWLADSGLKGVHDAYVQNNADLVEAEQAQFRFNESMAGVGAALEPIQTELQNLAATILEKITPVIQEIVQWTIDNLPVIAPIVSGIAAALGVLAAALAISSLISGVQKAFALLNATMLANPIVLIVAAIAGLVAAFVTLWNNCDAFKQFWIDLWENIKNIVVKAWEGIKKIFTTVINFVKDNWQSLLLLLVNPIWGAFKLLYEHCDGFRNFVDNFLEKLKQLFKKGIDAIANFFTTTIPDTINKVVKWFSELPAKIGNAISGALDTVVTWGKNLLAKGKEAASNLLSTVVDTLKGLPGKLVEVGKNVVSGIWEGISGGFTWIKDKLTGWVGNVTSFIKGLFGIHSPSALMRDEVGKMLGLGMAEGIEESRSAVNAAMRDLGNAAMGGLPGNVGAVGAGGYAAGGGKTIIINQTNNSPRALSRLEIYRQTHNALAYAGGM